MKLLKVSIFLMAITFITYKIYTNRENLVIALKEFNYFLLFPLFIFMFVNWFLESIKWKISLKKVESISTYQAFKSVLSGLTIGIFTPNRIGNFIGRVLYVQEENRTKATLLSFYTNLSQLLATIGFGIIGLSFLFELSPYFNDVNFQLNGIRIVAVLFFIFLIFVYLKPKVISSISKKISNNQKFEEIMNVLPGIPMNCRSKILLLSFGRYIIFTTQFTWLLYTQNEEVGLFLIWLGTTVTYLISTIIPSPALGKFGIRESVSLFVFGLIGLSEQTIILASLLLWMINLMIPALFGGVFLLVQKTKSA